MQDMSDRENIYDLLENAGQARTTKEALQWIRKAREAAPDNLDAALAEIQLTQKTSLDVEQRVRELLTRGEVQMRTVGFFSEDNVGDFWALIETRPYMRVRMAYIHALLMNYKIRCAAQECEELIRLCTSDNLGARYILIHSYAYLQEEESAYRLLERFENEESSQFLLAMSALMYSLNKEDEARGYLVHLLSVNKDSKKFFAAIGTEKLNIYVDQLSPHGYRPHTIDELLTTIGTYGFFYDNMSCFFAWAKPEVRKMKVTKKTQ